MTTDNHHLMRWDKIGYDVQDTPYFAMHCHVLPCITAMLDVYPMLPESTTTPMGTRLNLVRLCVEYSTEIVLYSTVRIVSIWTLSFVKMNLMSFLGC